MTNSSYCYVSLTKKKQEHTDQQVIKNRAEFSKGFKKGIKVSFTIYSLYTLMKPAASDASSINPETVPKNQPPMEQPQVSPAPAKPGCKPLSPATKSTLSDGISEMYYAAAQSGDFILEFSYANDQR